MGKRDLNYLIKKGYLKMAKKKAGRKLTFLELEKIFNACFKKGALDEAREVAMEMDFDKRVYFLKKVNNGSIDVPGYIDLDMLDEFVRTCNLIKGQDEFHRL